MISSGILTIDVHGMTKEKAKITINSMITRASKNGVYILRIIHGFNNGTQLRTMIRSTFVSNKKVLKTDCSMAGQTDLYLREL